MQDSQRLSYAGSLLLQTCGGGGGALDRVGLCHCFTDRQQTDNTPVGLLF
jgi:hypothetical protein